MNSEQIALTVGERLYGIMWRNRISQADVASALGVSQTGVSRRLRGKATFSVADYVTIAAVLGVSPGSLLAEVMGERIVTSVVDAHRWHVDHPETQEYLEAPIDERGAAVLRRNGARARPAAADQTLVALPRLDSNQQPSVCRSTQVNVLRQAEFELAA